MGLPTTVAISAAERRDGTLHPHKLAVALEALRRDGIVNIGSCIDPEHIDCLREKLLADMASDNQPEQLRQLAQGLPMPDGETIDPFQKNPFMSLRPPPFAPYLFRDIVYNEQALAVSCEYIGDHRNPTLVTYGANSSYPGVQQQNIHRDAANDTNPTLDSTPGVVLNVPMQDFAELNGATQVFLGTHLVPGVPAEAKLSGDEARTIASKGDCLIRDLRLCHGGMPNLSRSIRTMLAMVHISASYTGVDESGFRGFAAQEGSERFWNHPRLNTSVHFEPAPIDYKLPGHSAPATELRKNFDARRGPKL